MNKKIIGIGLIGLLIPVLFLSGCVKERIEKNVKKPELSELEVLEKCERVCHGGWVLSKDIGIKGASQHPECICLSPESEDTEG